jgi:hypothetical protein
MELETKIASPLGAETKQSSQNKNRGEQVQQILSQQTQSVSKTKRSESKLDIISAAVVIGMTVQFITFLFGLVTEFVPRILDLAVISLFLGLFVTVIAYAMMKESQ